jgi:protein-disulfide isomerase
MRARMTLALTAAAAALPLPACHKNQPPPEQNAALDNGLAANADIETLPADESSATPSNQLANGFDNPDVNATTNNSD